MAIALFVLSFIFGVVALKLTFSFVYVGQINYSLPVIIDYLKVLKNCKIKLGNKEYCKNIKNIHIKLQKFKIGLRLSKTKLILNKNQKVISSPQKTIKLNNDFLKHVIETVEKKLSVLDKKFRGFSRQAIIEKLAQILANKISFSEPINAISLVNWLVAKKLIYCYERGIFYYVLAQYLLINLAQINVEVSKANKKILNGANKQRLKSEDYFSIYAVAHYSKNAAAQLVGLTNLQIKSAIRKTIVYYQFLSQRTSVIVNWLKFIVEKKFVK